VSSAPEESSRSELHPAVRIGHVNLRVADLDRATSFYRDVLGFEVTAYGSDFGLPGAAFLAAGDYHHHIGLNTWQSQGGTPPPEGHTGLHHFAIFYPDRRELARTVERILEHGYPMGERRTTGQRSQCTCATPTVTASSFTTTAERGVGRPRPNRSILATCWWSRAPPLNPYSP
jgi:catechol-2,3-dioxygenase